MAALILPGLLCTVAQSAAASKTNFVILFADDMGYGDLSSFGHPTQVYFAAEANYHSLLESLDFG